MSAMVAAWPCARVEPHSPSAPSLRMMARSGLPVAAMVRRKPADMERIETSAPTAQAMPITTTSDEPSRCGTLVRLMRVTAEIWVRLFIGGSLSPGQGINNGKPLGAQGRGHPGGKTDKKRKAQSAEQRR